MAEYSPLIDGLDIKTLDLQWLRRHCIGYINQEPTLFATSIWENIRYGRPDATDFEVMEAARSGKYLSICPPPGGGKSFKKLGKSFR